MDNKKGVIIMAEKSREQLIHEACMKIMSEVGVYFDNPKAVDILKDNDIKVNDDNVAFFTEDQVMKYLKMAPSQFTVYAPDPKNNVVMGDGSSNPAPDYGSAFVDDWDGNRRPSTWEDYVKAVKLCESEPCIKFTGGILAQPNNVSQEFATIAMFYAMITHSKKAMIMPTGYKEEMETMLKACCEWFGGKDAFCEKTRFISLINTVSPLRLDDRMLDNLMLMAEHNQAVIVAPASMLGATSPIYMAGAIASGLAESLAGICLAQMIRPGAPCVIGCQSVAADMRGDILYACASPEAAIMQGYAGKMGKFYGLPSRGGGCLSDASRVNVQAGYESMLNFYNARDNNVSIIIHCGGVTDAVNALCFEKMMVDFEIMREAIFVQTPIEINEDTLDFDEIAEIAQMGTFLDCDSTLEDFRTLYSPKVGMRSAKDPDYMHKTIDAEIQRLLNVYNADPKGISDEDNEKVKAVLVSAGVDCDMLDQIRSDYRSLVAAK